MYYITAWLGWGPKRLLQKSRHQINRMECIIMRFITVALFVAAVSLTLGLSSVTATPPPNYPVDAYDEVTMCVMDPGCIVQVEERVPGDVGLAEELTYRNPICIEEGCIVVCDTHACWCEADDKCQ